VSLPYCNMRHKEFFPLKKYLDTKADIVNNPRSRKFHLDYRTRLLYTRPQNLSMNKRFMKMGKIIRSNTQKVYDKSPSSNGKRRIQVRQSGIHGKGVFAVHPIDAGETLLEYKGEIITWTKALARHPHDKSQPHHTFYFHLDDHHVIDAKYNGNSAKWINHSCQPNLEAEQKGNRVFLKALRHIKAGEELSYDYSLVVDSRKTPRLKKEYACYCGAANCRGTMLDCK